MAAPNAPPPPDELDAVQAMFGSDFDELSALYRRDAPGRIAGMRAALAAGDFPAAAALAHAFAGSSVSIGATALGALCHEVEIAAKAATPGLLSRIDHIDAEYRRIQARLLAMTQRS